MEKKLKAALIYYEECCNSLTEKKEKKKCMKDLLIIISFFQHERLIHLLVTLSFALLTVMGVIGCCLIQNVFIFVLTGLFVILLVPYIRHYYILENGVQKLYKYYDRLKK